jgi:hypothetical protein
MADIWDGESPNAFLIREHFRQYELEKWDWARITRLCRLVRRPAQDIFALAAVSRQRADYYIKRAKDGKTIPPEIALHFAQMEQYAHEHVFQTASFPSPKEIQTAMILAQE